MSQEGQGDQEGGRGVRRAGQVQAGVLRAGWQCLCLEGPSWLGAALVGFSVKHHD